MRSAVGGSALIRATLAVVAAFCIGYLAVLAAWPGIRTGLPAGLRWFGQPNSAVTIAIVVGVLVLLAVSLTRSAGARRPGAPVAIVVGLALITALLGMTSYWRCQDDTHPDFFTPLVWTVTLVKGGNPEQSLAAGKCPNPTPVALQVAQISALAAVLLSVIGVGMALFRSRLDRLRVYFAPSVTAVADLDDDATSMIAAIKGTLDRRTALAVLTNSPDRPCVAEARNHGARIITVDFDRRQTWLELSLWRKLDSLYLLSADPSVNLSRLAALTAHLATSGRRHRVPLVVRIDDPWQATAWRASQFGKTDRRWAADAVGKYEITARRLLDRIAAAPALQRIVVCGTSQLTLALCADIAQRQLERDYYGRPALPEMVLVASDADDYRADHEYSRRQAGLPHDRPSIRAISEPPTLPQVAALLTPGPEGAVPPGSVAVIMVDTDALSSLATRLAVRFPETPIYSWDPAADSTEHRIPLVGQMQTFRLSMDLPDGQAHDSWELAARLIHERYAKAGGTPATRPWPELSEFYKESNRRQVSNALWMVEAIGGHTWDTWGSSAKSWSPADIRDRPAVEQLTTMGFSREAVLAMARAEHEDWCRFYRRHGWSAGANRDDARKIHPNLVDWSQIERDPQKLDRALASLAATLSKLRELGYRSRPASLATE